MYRRPAVSLQSRLRWTFLSLEKRRDYHLPAGTFPSRDPRSIYDSQVHHLWKPSVWFDAEKRARTRLRAAAEKAFNTKESELEETRLQAFFVPYWLVRIGIFSPVDYATMSREFVEGRISVDVTFSFSGTDHHALKKLHFLSPKSEVLEAKVVDAQPVEGFVYVPFAQAPPSNYKQFFEEMTDDNDLLVSRNLKLRHSWIQSRMAARPVLEPIVLGEYRHQGNYITVASCPRLGSEGTRVFSQGTWTHDSELVGESKASFSIAWEGPDPKGVDYSGLEATLQSRAASWLRRAALAHGRSITPTREIWTGPSVTLEGFNSIRPWREAKLDLWQQGYELARDQS